jgi:hypothetical protein
VPWLRKFKRPKKPKLKICKDPPELWVCTEACTELDWATVVSAMEDLAMEVWATEVSDTATVWATADSATGVWATEDSDTAMVWDMAMDTVPTELRTESARRSRATVTTPDTTLVTSDIKPIAHRIHMIFVN